MTFRAHIGCIITGDDGIPTTPPAEPAPTLTDEADDSLSTPPAEPADPIEPTDLADEPVDEPIDDGSSEQADVSVLPADAQAQPQDMGAPGIAQEAGSSSMKSEGNSSAGLIAGIAAGGKLPRNGGETRLMENSCFTFAPWCTSSLS